MDHEASYGSWFQLADEDQDGRLTGGDAVKFFSRSGLAKDMLAKIWAIADSTRQGYLGKTEFLKAMTGIALVQNNIPLSLEAVNTAAKAGSGAPIAFMDGLKVAPEAEKGNSYTDAFSRAYKHSETKPPVPPGKAGKTGLFGGKASLNGAAVTSIVDGLKKIYLEKIKPLELLYKFDSFYGPVLTESDFEAKPSVLLLGQYSTGKTTFIKHLLNREYPGSHIGPEPTTDRFVVVMGGVEERRTPGNTLVVQTDKPFTGLTKFGTSFLSKFECAQCDSDLLQVCHLSLLRYVSSVLRYVITR
jgi:EH domain-containing protein 1